MIFTHVPKSDECCFSRSFWESWKQFSFCVILPLIVKRVISNQKVRCQFQIHTARKPALICSFTELSPALTEGHEHKKEEIYCKEICKTFIYLQDIANVGMLSHTNALRFKQPSWCLKNIFSTAQKGFRHAPVVNNSRSSGN